MKEPIPLGQKGGMPNANLVFDHELPGTTPQNRPDIIALLDVLLSTPEHVNFFVYSEPDLQINFAWSGFSRNPDSIALKELPLDGNADAIVDYIHNRAGFIDLTGCFWCETTNLASCFVSSAALYRIAEIDSSRSRRVQLLTITSAK